MLILSDGAKIDLGHAAEVGEPAARADRRPSSLFGATIPHYNLFILLLGPGDRAGVLVRAAAHARGRGSSAPPRSTARRSGRSASTSDALYTWVFVLASFLGGLGGALISPMRAITPGMDTEIIVEAFVVVVIGGLGSFWGTFLGALIYGQVLSFGILFFPRFSIFAGLRPHGRRADRPALGPARAAAQVMARLARVPWGAGRAGRGVLRARRGLALLRVPGQRHRRSGRCSPPA